MAKMHLKRLAAPNTWPIARKVNKFVARPFPGSHGFDLGISLGTLLLEVLEHVSTKHDLKKVLNQKIVQVDGVARTHPDFFVGLFDTVSIAPLNKHYRLSISAKGKLVALPISAEESKRKICKIVKKTYQKQGLVQLNLHDGYNLLIKQSDNTVGDSIVMTLPGHVPETYLSLEKGSLVYLTHGSHRATLGTVVDVSGRSLTLDVAGEKFSTLKKYAFVVGKTKPVITVVV